MIGTISIPLRPCACGRLPNDCPQPATYQHYQHHCRPQSTTATLLSPKDTAELERTGALSHEALMPSVSLLLTHDHLTIYSISRRKLSLRHLGRRSSNRAYLSIGSALIGQCVRVRLCVTIPLFRSRRNQTGGS